MGQDHCCKVGRVATKREIEPPPRAGDDLDEYLIAKWKGEGQYESEGIRPLAEWFNKQVLEAGYDDAGRSSASYQINREYELLSSHEHSEEQAELVQDLTQMGIDVDDIKSDFISRGTIRRHFKLCLDAEKQVDRTSDNDWEPDHLRVWHDRFEMELKKALTSYRNKGEIHGIDDIHLKISVYVQCPEEDCNTQATIETAFNQGYVCPDHVDTDEIDPTDDDTGVDESFSSFSE